jgi:catechol 2,3-dioxygenase-like lactoylglutathione lyase family enzyme
MFWRASTPDESATPNGLNPLTFTPQAMDQRRINMFSKIMYTTLYVTNQDEALEFYTTMFGFEKRIDYPGSDGRFLTIGFQGQGLEVILMQGVAGQPNAALTATPISGPGPLFIESDDLRKDFDRLKSHGVAFVDAQPEDYPYGVRVTALDPDGNQVELRQTRK